MNNLIPRISATLWLAIDYFGYLVRLGKYYLLLTLVNVRFHMHTHLGRWQFVFPVYKCFGLYQEYVVERNTELVIEGYPRTASSYFYHAFCIAQGRAVKIAYHLHLPAHVKRAVAMGIPTVVLIRSPGDAVASASVREPHIGTGILLVRYWVFYKALLAIKQKFVVADFTEVTTDIGGVIDKINKKYQEKFVRFENTSENRSQVKMELEQRHRDFGGTELTSYEPNKEKENAKQKIDFSRHKRMLEKCQALYDEFKRE